MKADDVPVGLLRRAIDVMNREGWRDSGVAAALAAVIPLVQAQEREACAAVCDARFMGDLNREDQEARRCAAAIRARNPA